MEARLDTDQNRVRSRPRELMAEAQRLDLAAYRAVAGTSTPLLDVAMRRLSQAANNSKLWIGCAALLATTGRRGRIAAASGVASVAATSLFANAIIKPIGNRRRPDRGAEGVATGRHVEMPGSRSFPSGHAASAAAFASATGRALPAASLPLHCAAVLVSYSRVHTGVHYPGDALAGFIVGEVIADVVGTAAARYAADCGRTGRSPSS